MINQDGWLEGAIVVPSVRHSPLDTELPLCIVHHATSTKASVAALARRIRSYKAGVDRAASWHLIVGKDGRITQSVPFTRGAWHCRGNVKFAGMMFRTNRVSIGIEWEHEGPVNGKWGPYTVEQKLAWPILRERIWIWRGEGLPQFGHFELGKVRGEHADPGPEWLKFLRGDGPAVHG